METTKAGFTAKDVMALRQKTGLGMMDCKQALTETNGDMAAAEEWLRQKAKGKMAQRTELATAEGLIDVEIDGGRAAIVEVQTQTDFGVRAEQFPAMVREIAKRALEQAPGPVEPDAAMRKLIEDVAIVTKENIRFARGEKLEGSGFATYIHHDGKRAAVIEYEGEADPALLTGICQHVVAHDPAPIGIDEGDVPAAEIEKIKADARQEAADSGKPPEIIEKIAEGKARKHLQEKTLLNQVYIRADKDPVRKVLPPGLKIKRFVRYVVGG